MSKQLYVAEKWFSRGETGTTTSRINREDVEKAIAMQTANEDDLEDWKESLYERSDLYWSAAAMLSEIAHSTFIVNRKPYTVEQLNDANGIAVESEESLWGIGATKEAAKTALLCLLANGLNEEDW